MYRLLEGGYTFVATEEPDAFRTENGWELKESVPYELNIHREEHGYQKALALACESDAVLIGSAPEEFIMERLKKQRSAITFRYSERLYKKGRKHFFSPGTLRRMLTYYRFYNRKLYMLCASAYTSADLRLQGTYLGRCYQWGYFPETRYYEGEELSAKKSRDIPELVWCGRFIGWKHPEAAITLAHRLSREKIPFRLKMIGTGYLENHLKLMVREYGLEEQVSFPGSMSPRQVREHMETANIFLMTSNFEEGWGAVVNEAMNSGCGIVASHAAGCVPYLITDNENGLIYENGNDNSLYRKVTRLLSDRVFCEQLGQRAYETIISEWNAETAAKRLLLLIEDLKKQGCSDRFQRGPCSKAYILKNNWYKEKEIQI